jgi:Asp-tRNA(Asn)/Glu-tRNA(Gln) amidotransferase B subunit
MSPSFGIINIIGNINTGNKNDKPTKYSKKRIEKIAKKIIDKRIDTIKVNGKTKLNKIIVGIIMNKTEIAIKNFIKF